MDFKSFFIKEDEGEKQKVEKKTDVTPIQTTTTNVTPSPVQSSTVISEVDEAGLKHLWEVLADRNLPGPDYLEIRNFSESLRATGDPIEKRMQSAFLMLKAQHPDFSKDVLLKSIETYRAFISEEKKDGQSQFEAKRLEKIGNKESVISNTELEIEKRQSQIEELKRSIEEMKSSINSIKQEIQVSTEEINREEQKFKATFDFFMNVLDNDVKIINNLNI